MKLFVGTKGLVMYDGKVLLLRESGVYEDGTNVGKWDVPGGRIDPDEAVRDGLVREVIEETGLRVEPEVLLGVFDGYPKIKGEDCHVVRLYFRCKANTDEVTLSSDHDLYEWVDPKNPGHKDFMDDIAEMLAAV